MALMKLLMVFLINNLNDNDNEKEHIIYSGPDAGWRRDDSLLRR